MGQSASTHKALRDGYDSTGNRPGNKGEKQVGRPLIEFNDQVVPNGSSGTTINAFSNWSPAISGVGIWTLDDGGMNALSPGANILIASSGQVVISNVGSRTGVYKMRIGQRINTYKDCPVSYSNWFTITVT